MAKDYTVYLIAMLIFTSTFAGLIITAPTTSAGINGNITIDTTWSGTVYIEGDVTVDPGVVLTVDPGTSVNFNGMFSLYVEGTINATGSNFTSNQSTPSRGDWRSIQINSTGDSNIINSAVEYSKFGLVVEGSIFNNVTNCYFKENEYGLISNNSAQVEIVNGGFINNTVYGIECDGTSYANWLIEEYTNSTNNTILIRGNLTVQNGGNPTFKNITWIVNSTSNGEFWIQVLDDGNLTVSDYDNNPITKYDSSNFTAYNDNFHYKFLVWKGNLTMKNSEVHQVGWNIANKGLTLSNCEWLWLENSTFSDNFRGLVPVAPAADYYIINCNIIDNSWTGIEFGVFNGYYGFIQGSNISNNGWYGIEANGAKNLRIENTNISDNTFYGFYGQGNSGDNVIQDSNISNNNVGVFLINSNNTKIINCTLADSTGGNGLAAMQSTNITLDESKIYGNAFDAVQIQTYSTLNMTNSTISVQGFNYDISIYDNSSVGALNVTFDPSNVYVQDFSNITTQWFMHVKVIDTGNNPVPSANLWINDSWGNEEQYFTTDVNGFNNWTVTTQNMMYTNAGNFPFWQPFTPHNASASKSPIGTGYYETTMDQSKFVEVQIGELMPPTITLTTPEVITDWTGGTPHAIWWNCTDTEDTTTDSLTVFINYTSSDGSGVIAGPLLNETAKPHIWALPAIDANDAVVQATVIDSNGAKGFFDTPAFTIDSTSPQLIEVSPTNNTELNPPDVLVVLTFDESMNQAETEAAFTLKNSTSVIAGTFSWNAQSTEMTFDPTQDLELNTTYWANLTTGAEDDSAPGNAIASFNSTEFKIMQFVDNVGPAVTIGPIIEPNVVYVDGVHDTTIWINATIDDFNLGNNNIAAAELMIWNASVPTIAGGTGIPMNASDGAFDEMNETVTINQDGFTSIPEMTLYYWIHGQDSEGNWGDWELITLEIIELPDAIPPQLLSHYPTGTYVNPNSSVLFSFDEEMNHTSVQNSLTVSPYLDGAGGYFFNTGNYQDYNFSMVNNFHQNITYTITINSSIAKDPAGNFLDGNENGIAEGTPTDDVSWSFTTWWDRDGDGIPENIDPDDDNDGVNDTEDDFPLDPDETVDTDGDGTGDNADDDDDGDGVPDDVDLDPLDPSIGGDTTPPSAPTHLNLTAQDNGIFVKWEASPEPDVHHYSVYRSTDNTIFTRIDNVTSLTSYFDGDVVSDTTYYYKVTAVDNASNESPFSDVEDITWRVSEQPPANINYLPYILLVIIIVAVLVALALLKIRSKKPEDNENKEEKQDEMLEDIK